MTHPLMPKNWSLGSALQRFDAVEPYIRGKSVLDLGCAVGHAREDWFHGLVRSVAAETIGLDIDAEAVALLEERGFDVVVGDAQDFRLGRRFDAVLAGELIEHLANLDGFLRSAEAHLSPEGLLLLTTPNPFSVSNFVYRFWENVRVNPEHTCWFCETTLRNLLSRYRFVVDEVHYLRHRTPGLVRRLLATLVRSPLPERLAWRTILVVARLKSPEVQPS